MQSRLIAIAAAATLSLFAASTASAATDVGNRCSANESTGPISFISLANAPGNPLPATIPGSGVITHWSFSVGLPIGPEVTLFETLKVFRPTGAKQFQVVGESSKERVTSGTQTFATRIPVSAGDTIGALAEVPPSTGSVFCKTLAPGDRVGAITGVGGVGSTATVVGEEEGLQNPVVVSVEPDADNDGYGDETQDQCPQSNTTQAACPVVQLSSSVTVKKNLVTVVLTGTTAAKCHRQRQGLTGQREKGQPQRRDQSGHPGNLHQIQAEVPGESDQAPGGTAAEQEADADDHQLGAEPGRCADEEDDQGETEGTGSAELSSAGFSVAAGAGRKASAAAPETSAAIAAKR